ncbi:MAG: hypothetical protein HWE18_12065 [Gammaproteobacteria bacterium]|nr:hypothetical protein [Gammaproteobacteria bacterium]
MIKKILIITVSLIVFIWVLNVAKTLYLIHEIEDIEPSKATMEYREFYKQQSSKDSLTMEEFEELKRREAIFRKEIGISNDN